MPFKSVGTFDIDALYEIYDDPTKFFPTITEGSIDIRVMEVGLDGQPELWHDDYAQSDGAWVEAGEFDSLESASDAAGAFPEGDAIEVFDYTDNQAKLMVRESGE